VELDAIVMSFMGCGTQTGKVLMDKSFGFSIAGIIN
jgi:hypothetical protein